MKKKIISLLLAFSILASAFVVLPAVGASAATNVTSVLDDGEKNASVVTIKTGADGTNSAPVEIWNAEQLIDFAKRVRGDEALGYEANNRFSAILKADIDLNPGYSFKLDYSKKLVEVYKDGELVNYVDPGYNSTSNAGKWYAADGTTEVDMPEGFTVWTPIGDGTAEGSYYGYFDGNACKVSGVYVVGSGNNVGFFGRIGSYFASNANTTGSYAATVKSFTVKDSLIVGGTNVGAVAGSSVLNNNTIACGDGCTISTDAAIASYPRVTINSLANENSVVVATATGDCNIGGVLGLADAAVHDHNGNRRKTIYATATNFYNSGDVLGKGSNVGGIIGNNVRLPMSDFTNTGNVYGGSYVAGISARITDGYTHTKLYNYGNVTGTGERVGGITAFTFRTVTTAFNAGNITGTTRVAGIVAWVQDGSGFTQTANVGNITATSSSGVAGGIIGDFNAAGKEIKNSYNAGVINAFYAAGITGTTKVTAAITNCHSTVEGNMNAIATDANTAAQFRCSVISERDLTSGALALTLGTGFGQAEGDAYPIPGKSGIYSVYIEGEGTEDSPYLIYSETDLRAFANLVNSGKAKYAYAELMADINLNRGIDMKLVENDTLLEMTASNGVVAYYGTGTGSYNPGIVYKKSDSTYASGAPTGWPGLAEWTPIGTSANPYYGHFNGNGYTVSGMYTSNVNGAGLFGYCGTDTTSGFTVDGVKIRDSYVWGNGYTGALVGNVTTTAMPGSNNVEHKHTVTKDASGKVVSYECEKGAKYDISALNASFSGYSKEEGGVKTFKITNCEAADTAVCSTSGIVGGLVGTTVVNNHKFKVNVVVLDENGEVASETNGSTAITHRVRSNCYIQYLTNYASVGGNGKVGGVIGEAQCGLVYDDTNYGTVYTNSGSYAAGIAGGTNNCTLTRLYNYGNVTSKSGRAAGINADSFRAATYAFNAGNITGANAAGITCYIMDAQTFDYCANVGTIKATNGVAGGIFAVGRSDYDTRSTIKNSYNAGKLVATNGTAAFAITKEAKTSQYTLDNCFTVEGYNFADRNGTVYNAETTTSCAYVTADQVKNAAAENSLLSKLGTSFGQSVNMDYPVPNFKSEFVGTDVTLKDGVLLNFYADVSVNVNAGDAELVTMPDGKQYYKVTVAVDAKDMGEAQSVTVAGATYTMSVAEYAAGILAGEEYTAEAKALVQAMLNYGAAAQNYFGKTDELVGTPVTDTSALAGAEVAAPTVTDANKQFIGASLILEGTMKLRFYFKGNSLEVTVDGVAAEIVNGEGYCYVDVAVTPDSIDELFEVAAGDVSVKYGALNYLKNNVNNEKLSEMVASIYAYSVAAEAYVAVN